MIKIDLITGFLGSGKTTFIKIYAQYLSKQGYKIGIIENDFGAVNVDMMLLQESIGHQCDLEMISGGGDQQTHYRRLKTKLIAMGMLGYDRILIEPSGIFDVDEFFDILYEEPLAQWYEIGNVMTIVNAQLENQLSQASEYMLASQVACAGKIILSQCQEASQEDIERTIEHIHRALLNVQCSRNIDKDILIRDWKNLTHEDFLAIESCGYCQESFLKRRVDHYFESLYYFHIHITKEKLYDSVEKIMHDSMCGQVFRIKGFMQIDHQWFELNATQCHIDINPINNGQDIIIVIGENLNDKQIQTYWKG